MDIRSQIIHRFALRDASRQRWHFRPVTAFFCFMNEHLQCHERILPHWAMQRKLIAASLARRLVTPEP